MKLISNLFLISVILCSCHTKNESTLNTTDVNAERQKLLAQFKPIIDGVWVKRDYIEKVVTTGSPLAAMPQAMGINVLNINTDSISNDSLVVAVGWNNHEGTQITLHFKPGEAPESLIFGDGALSYVINNSDTTLILHHYNEQKKAIEKTHYVRALSKPFEDDLEYGLNYLVNKKIITGTYKLKNKDGGGDVVFTNTGEISGLDSYKTYNIQTDFIVQYQNNLDAIMFDIGESNMTYYAFKLNKDTLMLYDTKLNADSSVLTIHELKYKLVRNK